MAEQRSLAAMAGWGKNRLPPERALVGMNRGKSGLAVTLHSVTTHRPSSQDEHEFSTKDPLKNYPGCGPSTWALSGEKCQLFL